MNLRSVFQLAGMLLFGVCLLLSGCGRYPPIVETSRDIERLSASEPSVRARRLHDRDIPFLARLRALEFLDFDGGFVVGPANITDMGLAYLAELDLPQLNNLALGHCGSITDAGLAHVARFQTLRHLSLRASPQITGAGLSHLLSMKRLVVLDLRGCPGITDDGLQTLAGKTNWAQIELGGCPNVTPDGVARLRAALPKTSVKKDDEEWSYHQRK